MDYLYDKVELYDSLKHIMQGHGWTDHIPIVQKGMMDIEHHMLHFLENHDEQRFASPDFGGDSKKVNPAMVVSATLTTSPTMIYFGQEVGEKAEENAGFGTPTRTSIFDYIGVPAHQRWMNEGAFDGGQLSEEEKSLREFYKTLMNFTLSSSALMGSYYDLHTYNRGFKSYDSNKVFSFARWSESERLFIISNFENLSKEFELLLPKELIAELKLTKNSYELIDQLYGNKTVLKIENGVGIIPVKLDLLGSLIFKIK